MSVVLALAIVVLLGYGATQIVGAVSPHMTAQDLHLPPQALNAPVTGVLPDNQPLHAALTFKIDPKAMEQAKNKDHRLAENNNLADTLGIKDSDYQRIQQFFQGPGAKLQLSKSRTRMTIDAPAGTLAKILQTRFVVHQLNGETFFTPDPKKMPQLPNDIAEKILAVTGLDNYGAVAQSSLNFNPTTAQKSSQAQASCTYASGAITPAQMAHAYGADSLWQQGFTGKGRTINLVEIGSFDSSDTQTYFDCIGFRGTLETINVHESVMPEMGETALDIEMAAAMAPEITIKNYQSYRTGNGNHTAGAWLDIDDALNRIIDDNTGTAHAGDVVSVSMIGGETYFDQNVRDAINQSMQVLSEGLGLTVYVSSGDCGAYMSGNTNNLEVGFPASSPYAVAVGGTRLYTDSVGNRTNEIAWSGPIVSGQSCNNSWGSTGGLSEVYARPAWQKGWFGVENPTYTNGKRQTPDISAIAINVAFTFNGINGYAGGTSISAPVLAAGMVLVNQKLLSAKVALPVGPQQFYNLNTAQARINSAYYDVVSGDNHYYTTTAGWDFVTGLGVPNLVGLASTMTSPQPNNGRLLQLQSNGYMYLYNGQGWHSWTSIAGNTALANVVANDNYIYAMHKDGTILTYTGGTVNAWRIIGNNTSTIAITADSVGHLYQLRKGGQIWQYGGNGVDNWIELDDNSLTTAIAASGNGQLYQLRSSGQVLKYAGQGLHSWTQVDQNTSNKAIAVGGNNLYVLHTKGDIWQLIGAPGPG
ncbi:hypothetical protein KSX_60630 [Ktedonospora formicarum]|uniref:Peptidase S53 domain-containing protein n=2 Tax=Ktedonospora formicarum TaxID=2778364 RepID=A0A8J3MWT2_9CHLR|nr:hypothetical protein KSX_60630 [Ktedonospora formicarum]